APAHPSSAPAAGRRHARPAAPSSGASLPSTRASPRSRCAPPMASDGPPRAPPPSAPLAPALPVKTVLVLPWPHPLKDWSLRESRGGSRRAIAPFLTGRRHIPLENGLVEIKAVSLLILNPCPGETLPARTGLSIPQLRRLIPCDVGTVGLGDLALHGETAVAAARQGGPVALQPPRGSCESFRGALIRLLPRVLMRDVLGMVDIE